MRLQQLEAKAAAAGGGAGGGQASFTQMELQKQLETLKQQLLFKEQEVRGRPGSVGLGCGVLLCGGCAGGGGARGSALSASQPAQGVSVWLGGHFALARSACSSRRTLLQKVS